jgi:uncharacterized phage protein gp47/JayE
MPIQTPKSSTQYAAEILAALQDTGVTNTTPGGKARALADIVADRMGICESNSFILASQNLLPYATGDAIDALGNIYGIPRISSADSSSDATDGNFEFHVQVGTFGSINNGQDIIIPAGTQLFTSGNSGPVYSVDTETTLPAANSEFFVSASSISTGSVGNAPANTITRHNFSNYAQASFGTLLITNNFGIVSGRDAEDDESYRFRINLKLQSTGGAGEVDLRAAILQLPGIQDVVFNPLAGTYQVFVYGISPAVPQSLLTLVQTAINSKTAYPLNGIALVPDLVGISLSTSLHLKSGLSISDQAAIISSAQKAAANYINNLTIGQELVINQIASVILNADTRILDIGDPNAPIQNIFIWRSRSDDTRYSRFLVNDYTPAIGERIIVESIANSINLIVVTTS